MSEEKMLHELGNLLAVIAGQAEFLLHQEPGADPAESRESLEVIRSTALRGRECLREARGAVTASPTPPSQAAVWDGPRRILLVDDEDDVRDAVAALLRQAGHSVEVASSGEDGVARYEKARFDCVVTDLGLPGLNGFTLCRVVKDRHPDVLVILMTGSSEEFEPAMVRAAGVDRVLFKPAGRSELLGAVAAARRSAQA
jgi:CheY-like chemotaxis protein